MTTLANVKGYINGNEWGVYEPAPSLLTYEEIVAMANTEGYPWTNTIAELNNSPTEYYNMLSQGGNITNVTHHSTGSNQPTIKGISEVISDGGTIIYYIYYINDLFVCDWIDYNGGGGGVLD